MPPVIGLIAAAAATVAANVTAANVIIGLAGAAVKFGLAYYQQKKAEKAQKKAAAAARAAQQLQVNFRSDKPPAYVGFGLARISGVETFAGTVGRSLYLQTPISAGLVNKIVKYYVNDTECLVDSDGWVVTAPFNNINGKFVRFEFRYGFVDQTASSLLTAAFPGIYTSQHQGKGIAHLLTQVRSPDTQEDYEAVFQSKVPERAVLAEMALIYDPRDSSQNPLVESTWKFSTNPALILLHYFTSVNGYRLRRSIFDIASFAACADFCDALIYTKSGVSRPRYECGGAWVNDETINPSEIVELILNTFAGRIYLNDNGFRALTCDGLDVAEVTLTSSMILDIDVKKTPGAAYEYTTIKAAYASEKHGYKIGVAEADPWVNSTAFSRVGREIASSMDLSFVFRHDQARRLMKLKWADLNPTMSIELVADFNALECYGQRLVRIECPEARVSGLFRIENITFGDDNGLSEHQLTLTSVDDTAILFDHNLEEGKEPSVAPTTEESIIPSAPTDLKVVVGNGTNTALVSWKAQTTAKTQIFNYKLNSGSVFTNVPVLPTDRQVMLSGLTGAALYNVAIVVASQNWGYSTAATINFTNTGTPGVTGPLTGFSVSAGVGKLYASAVQAVEAKAAYIQFSVVAAGAAADWGAPTTVLAAASYASLLNEIVKPAGAYSVYARSVGINGDTGVVAGPLAVTVTAAVVTPPVIAGVAAAQAGQGGIGANNSNSGANYGGFTNAGIATGNTFGQGAGNPGGGGITGGAPGGGGIY